ncbi:unnamed protein product [Brassica rapa]|uniref:Uncharacterized protein n=2 Tax=Brassica campestris TaxID=3711 RepID=A0A8D9GZ96_BRACM|nr:unnamed protein product [Brassica rapa]
MSFEITLIPHIKKRLACGDYGNGAMAEPSLIYSTVKTLLGVGGASAKCWNKFKP